MKNKQIIPLYISIVVLFVLTIISNFIEQNSLFSSIAAIIAVLIPAIYSAIPLIEGYRLKRNRNSNRLSENTFTDREEDLSQIIRKLSIKEHIIEISGDDEKCGKTWIAKRLFDYINFPEDFKNKKNTLPYKTAYYLDLDMYNAKSLEEFFEKNIINSNVVLIFDNVINMNYILSKQALYHFQLIYISKAPNKNNFFKHTLSRFHESNIKELQEKIRYNFPGIESITEQEIHILYKITNGNIGKIYSVLSKQTSVKWIKDIASQNRTEYDDILDSIKLILFTGEYEQAKKALDNFNIENKKYFLENNDLYYKYILIRADCEHLLNNYEEALSLLSILEIEPYCSNDNNYELELYKAHYYKHLWRCNESLNVLHKIKKQSFSAKVDALGILLAKYFINDLYVPYSDQNSLEEFYNVYIDAQNININSHDYNNVLKHKRCTAIFMFYKNRPLVSNELIENITNVIMAYKAQNNRLVANAYFIRGEIHRVYGNYDDAIYDYSNCLSITHDNNIIVQTNLIIYYLIKCKRLNLEYNVLPVEQIIELCKYNKYASKVYHRINSIILKDPNSPDIIKCFDTRIMPIL